MKPIVQISGVVIQFFERFNDSLICKTDFNTREYPVLLVKQIQASCWETVLNFVPLEERMMFPQQPMTPN